MYKETFTEEEKLILSVEALQSFFDQFEGPNDIYKEIFLETLFHELMGDSDDLDLPSPPGPQGGPTNH